MQREHSNPDVIRIPDNESMISDAVRLGDIYFEELAVGKSPYVFKSVFQIWTFLIFLDVLF